MAAYQSDDDGAGDKGARVFTFWREVGASGPELAEEIFRLVRQNTKMTLREIIDSTVEFAAPKEHEQRYNDDVGKDYRTSVQNKYYIMCMSMMKAGLLQKTTNPQKKNENVWSIGPAAEQEKDAKIEKIQPINWNFFPTGSVKKRKAEEPASQTQGENKQAAVENDVSDDAILQADYEAKKAYHEAKQAYLDMLRARAGHRRM